MIFDICYEGTTINECIDVRKYLPREIIVIDKCGVYGSTHNIKIMKECYHIENLDIKKLEVDNFSIEIIPPFLRPDSTILSEIKIPISYVYLDEYLVLNNIKYKIPYSKYDIATSTYLSLEDKHILYKSITENTYQNNSIIDTIGLDIIKKYFNKKPYLYPVYGMKEIAEQLSRLNAFTNISYCLSDVKIFEENNKLYFDYNKEKVYFKKLINREKKDKIYFKVIVSKKQILPRNSIIKYDNNVTALSLDEISRVVGNNHKMFTFWSKRKFNINDIEVINSNDILADIEYEGFDEIYI